VYAYAFREFLAPSQSEEPNLAAATANAWKLLQKEQKSI